MNLKQLTVGALAALSLGLTAVPAHAYILGYNTGAGGQLNLNCDINGCLSVTMTVAPVFAADNVTVVTPAGSGWYSADGLHFAGNDYYAVAAAGDLALSPAGNSPAYHDFLVFSLSDIASALPTNVDTGGVLVSNASLTLFQGSNGQPNSGASKPDYLRLGSYNGSSVADLESGAAGVSAFTALGNGNLFGYRLFTGADDNTNVDVDLNSYFVSQITQAINNGDQYIVLGGRIATAQEIADADLPPVPVISVPEPASWALMILGFLGVGAALRTRRRATLA